MIALSNDGFARGSLYADDELSFAYERGVLVHRTFEWHRSKDNSTTLFTSRAAPATKSSTTTASTEAAAALQRNIVKSSKWAQAPIERIVVFGATADSFSGATINVVDGDK